MEKKHSKKEIKKMEKGMHKMPVGKMMSDKEMDKMMKKKGRMTSSGMMVR